MVIGLLYSKWVFAKYKTFNNGATSNRKKGIHIFMKALMTATNLMDLLYRVKIKSN